mmetsp:Transcript_11758/g.35015  ORF Transcript_11758/g.35015 Transcript_11758/m.35015 type:complete len:374 (+) Transcript_11758:218-1339(+)
MRLVALRLLTMLRAARALAPLPAERFSVAPMMDYSDRHFRTLYRLLTKEAVLYTEMVTASTLVDERGNRRNGDGGRWLRLGDEGGRTLLQLGGAHPEQLRHAARLAVDEGYGYAGLNLNCGCPSDRVAGAGCFGAALMRDPKLVAECCAALADVAPTSVKCRIGVCETARDLSDDDERLYGDLVRFVETVSAGAPVTRFVVHARVAVLSGLSPDANRKVPPLKPRLVARLAEEFPRLEIVTNGEVADLATCERRGAACAGAMVGRDACRRPWHYAAVDSRLFGGEDPAASRREVLEAYAAYCDAEEARAAGSDYSPRRALLKPLLPLFHGDKGTGAFKREVDALHKDASLPVRAVVERAAACVPDGVLDAPPS